MTLIVGAASWCAKALLVFVPEQMIPIPILRKTSSSNDMSLMMRSDDRLRPASHSDPLARSSIGRALCQVFDLISDIPITSRKYEFARFVADKILSDNFLHGSQALREMSVRALEAGFCRTIVLLSKCLERLNRQQQVAAWAWPWRMLRDLPYSLIFQCVPLLGTIKNRVGTAISSPVAQMIIPASFSTTFNDGSGSDIVAEKLANELLWMAQRLKQNSALEIAITHWSSATALAHWSLSSSSRVQKLLVKLSAFLIAGLVSLDVELHPEVTLRLLLLWLPLLCRSNHVIDETTLSSSDKSDTEQILSKAIRRLPDGYQEVVLAMWLTEFIRSPSDWPNVQACYHGWCQSTRKLYY